MLLKLFQNVFLKEHETTISVQLDFIAFLSFQCPLRFDSPHIQPFITKVQENSESLAFQTL